MSMTAPAVGLPGGISYEEFLATVDEGTHAEWVDGEVVRMSPASDRHHDIKIFLATLFRTFSDLNGLGVVRDAGFQMKTGPELPGREPDVFFIARENVGRLRKTFLEGPADLALEIVSPESVERDRRLKFQEYQKGGVREYWLIDPSRREATVYRLSRAGVYEPAPAGDPPRLRSEVMRGLSIDPEWLWSEPTPSVAVALREWGLV
jgi:Uma2 family endonuclease